MRDAVIIRNPHTGRDRILCLECLRDEPGPFHHEAGPPLGIDERARCAECRRSLPETR